MQTKELDSIFPDYKVSFGKDLKQFDKIDQ